jgi:PAS domain S-box-containing protein
MEAGDLGAWDWSIADDVVTWTERLEQIFGLDPGSFEGTVEDFLRRVHPDDRSRVEAVIGSALEGADDVYAVDFRTVLPGGSTRWMSTRGRVVRDADGAPTRMLGVVGDITERVLIQARIDAQLAVTSLLAAATDVGSVAVDLVRVLAEPFGWTHGGLWLVQGDRLRWQGGWARGGPDAFTRATEGSTFERDSGLPGRVWARGEQVLISDLHVDHDFPRAGAAAEAGLRAGLAFPLRLGGDVIGVVEFFSPGRSEGWEELGATLEAVGSQIAQFVRRKDAERAAKERDARRAAILEAASDAIITIDDRGRVLDFNPAAARLFGLEREHAIGGELAEMIVPPEFRERHRAGLERFRATGEAPLVGRPLELIGVHADGHEFPVELTITKVDLGDRVLFKGFLRDITERRRREEWREQLLASERRALAEAERARARATFLADASVALTSSLSLRRTLAKVAKLAVPRIADRCVVELLEPDGSLQIAAIEPPEPHHAPDHPLDRRVESPAADQGVAWVLREGKVRTYAGLPPGMHLHGADPEAASSVVAPLIAHGSARGVITLVRSEAGRGFDADDLELVAELARRAAVAIDNARLYEERARVARTLQRSLLPSELPQADGFELVVHYEAAGEAMEVGGDFYDAFEVEDGRWGVVIGDVSGKGVEAAAVTGLVRHSARAIASRGADPEVVLRGLNDVLLRAETDRMCTVAYGLLEPSAQGARLRIASAGHPSPRIVRVGGKVDRAEALGPLLGVMRDIEVPVVEMDLVSGELLVLFTDGVTDPRRDPAIDEETFDDMLRACAGQAAADAVAKLAQILSDPDAPDDVALLVARVR